MYVGVEYTCVVRGDQGSTIRLKDLLVCFSISGIISVCPTMPWSFYIVSGRSKSSSFFFLRKEIYFLYLSILCTGEGIKSH